MCHLRHILPALLWSGLGLVYAILMGAVELFGVCSLTAFYYECKGSNEVVTTDQYVRVSTDEQPKP